VPLPMRRPERDERGYFSVLTIIMFVTLFGLAAFAVDVGNWYLTGQREQRAADAAALAGVPSLPGNKTSAFSTAQTFSDYNGFKNGVDTVTVVPSIDGAPTRLRVTVTKTVDNVFGSLFGIPTTTITRTAVADFAGPVPMGSPCNTFGNDPDPGTARGSTCGLVNGQLWANVNGRASQKINGDAYQSYPCTSTTTDLCTSNVNTEFQTDGYYYMLTLKQPVTNLVIQAFDAAWVDVGLTCTSGNFGSGSSEGVDARNDWVTDETTRYASGNASNYCTGDNAYTSGTTAMKTQFTVRDPSPQTWDPTTYPVHAGCQKTYNGYSGALFPALNKGNANYRDDIAQSFRRWDTLCTIASAPAGEYLIQVKSNGVGTDTSDTGNRFALRAYSSTSSTAKESISISARERMGIYSNKPSATTEFYLARVPSGAGGQILTVKLFDVGDTSTSVTGTIQLVAPPDSGVTFTNCKGTGVVNGTLSSCSFTVAGGSSNPFNGKNQFVSIPIPAAYTCVDTDPTKCWVRLKYVYGSGSAPNDVTSWEASIEGDPVRLVE
jgi:Flp pilus assembly protein TadG